MMDELLWTAVMYLCSFCNTSLRGI